MSLETDAAEWGRRNRREAVRLVYGHGAQLSSSIAPYIEDGNPGAPLFPSTLPEPDYDLLDRVASLFSEIRDLESRLELERR